MSGGGGSNSGGNDMEVSGMEAAVSKEKGIHTHADTRHQSTSYSGGDGGNNGQAGNAAPSSSGSAGGTGGNQYVFF